MLQTLPGPCTIVCFLPFQRSQSSHLLVVPNPTVGVYSRHRLFLGGFAHWRGLVMGGGLGLGQRTTRWKETPGVLRAAPFHGSWPLLVPEDYFWGMFRKFAQFEGLNMSATRRLEATCPSLPVQTSLSLSLSSPAGQRRPDCARRV